MGTLSYLRRIAERFKMVLTKPFVCIFCSYLLFSYGMNKVLTTFIFSNKKSSFNYEVPLLSIIGLMFIILFLLKEKRSYILEEKSTLLRHLLYANHFIWIYQSIRILASPFSHFTFIACFALILSTFFLIRNKTYYVVVFIFYVYLWRQDTFIFSTVYDSADMWLAINFSYLYFINILFKLFLKNLPFTYGIDEKTHTDASSIMILVCILTSYFWAGAYKLLSFDSLSYVTKNQPANLFIYYFNSGLNNIANFRSIQEFIIKILSSDLRFIVNFIVLISELLLCISILNTTLFTIILVVLILMHIILLSCGLFFWKWVVFDLILIYSAICHNELKNQRFRYIIALSFFFLLSFVKNDLLKKVFYYDGLGWSDGEKISKDISRISWHFLKETSIGYQLNGRIDPAIFYPFEKNMNQAWNHVGALSSKKNAKELDYFIKNYEEKICNPTGLRLFNHIWSNHNNYQPPCTQYLSSNAIGLVETIETLNESRLEITHTRIKSIYYTYPFAEHRR